MPVAIPLKVSLVAGETEESYIPVHELVRRITRAFPEAELDWERGKRHRLSRIEELLSMGCSEAFVAGERGLVDKTVYVGICFTGWPGNPVYDHLSGIATELEGLTFEAKTYDVELLKRAGPDLAAALNFEFSLGAGGMRTLDTDIVPGKHDPQQFARRCEPNFPMAVLRELPDWKRSLHRAVVLYLRQCEWKHQVETATRGFASYEDFASAVLDELAAISPVQKCWSIDIDDAPGHNAVILDHGNWMTNISLSGVPSGILT